jgi:CRP-like cAMP-binding protein
MAESTQNLLIDSLSPPTRAAVIEKCKRVELPMRAILYEQDDMPRYGYFLHSGVASVVLNLAEGGSAEVGLIGCEGVVGAMHILGPSPGPSQCFMQMPGNGLRMKLDDMQTFFQDSEEFRGRLLEFVQQQTVTLAQLAACNKLHNAEERLARWLLMARDREGHDPMPMTQEFLALMLGTRRTTVTLVAGQLQRAGLIEYTRGKVTILDRGRLEAAACDCYRITKQALDKLYNNVRPGRQIEPQQPAAIRENAA